MKISVQRLSQAAAAGALLCAIALLSPRAAHAVAAALVQVTNTISNPVVSQQITTAASQLVMLVPPGNASIVAGATEKLYQAIPGQGLGGNNYVVPAGQNFVLTELTVTGDGGAALAIYSPVYPGIQAFQYLNPPSPGTQEFTFPGIVYPAGSSVSILNSGSSAAGITAYGYLTAN